MNEHKDLCRLLVRDHVRLYQTSATFRASVAALAHMLPLMVRGFADHAVEHDGYIDAATFEELTRLGPGSFTLSQEMEEQWRRETEHRQVEDE